jgi:hypothetical protein
MPAASLGLTHDPGYPSATNQHTSASKYHVARDPAARSAAKCILHER